MARSSTRVSIAAIRQAAAGIRADGGRATHQAVARRLDLPESTIEWYAQKCIALFDTFDTSHETRIKHVPRMHPEAFEGTVMLKWLIERLNSPEASRLPGYLY